MRSRPRQKVPRREFSSDGITGWYCGSMVVPYRRMHRELNHLGTSLYTTPGSFGIFC